MQSVVLGQTVSFYCTSQGDVFWTFEGKTLPSNAFPVNIYGSANSWLTILNAQLHNSGTYACFGRNNDGSSFRAEGVMIVSSELLDQRN